jgi:hypothetical protein
VFYFDQTAILINETDFGVSSACGTGNTKISFLKARLRRAFKKLIFIMRIACDQSFALQSFDRNKAL